MKRNYMKAAAGICALSLVLNGMTMPVLATDQFSAVSVIKSAEAEVPTEGTCGENTVWKFTEDGTLEISGTGAMDEWTVESDRPWNDLRDKITNVVIGEGVTTIGERAFSYFSNVTEFIIPEGVETISYYAFANCKNLTSIYLSSTVTSFVWYHIFGDDSLKEIIVSEDNERLTSVDGIVYNKDITHLIISPAGYDKSEILKIPETVDTIESLSLSHCHGLKEIIIGKNVKIYSVPSDCINLEKVTVDEENAEFTSIDGIVYSKDLTELVHCPPKNISGEFIIPDGTQSIGIYSVGECKDITSIIIPSGVTKIETGAFRYCDLVTEITFPESVEEIGKDVLKTNDETLVRTVTILNPACTIAELSSWYDDSSTSFGNNPIIYGYPESTAEAYADKYGYEFRSLIYGESVTTTPTTTTVTETTTTTTDTTTSASETTTATTTSWVLTGPDGMQTTTVTTTTADNWEDENSGKFGDFYYTIQLDNTLSIEYAGIDAYVEIPAEINGRKVSVVAAESFRYNENVEHVVIPEGVTEIQPGAFMECSNLKSVVIPESISEINENTFLGCDSLESLTIENPDCIIHMANYTLPENVIIRCKSGSTAEAFAETFGYQVEILNNVVLTEEEIGDVSGDGTVGIDDATLVLTYYAMNAAGLEMTFNEDSAVNERLMAAADTDMDSLVSISDATMVLTYYAQNAAGLNPTWEGLRSK